MQINLISMPSAQAVLIDFGRNHAILDRWSCDVDIRQDTDRVHDDTPRIEPERATVFHSSRVIGSLADERTCCLFSGDK